MKRLRVLLVPDWLEWVTGTIARDIARYNPWISATILSGPVLRRLARTNPALVERFDLVHFLCPFASAEWLPILSARVPVVTPHFHVTDFDELAHNLNGDAIVAISSEWMQDLASRGADMRRVVMIPPGIDTDLFRPRTDGEGRALRKRLGLDGAGPVVGFFAKRGSNDDDRKGTGVFVAGVELMRKTGSDVGVLVVGPGWNQMADRFRELGARCAWLPFVGDRKELARLYGAIDFYWVTSRVEGGPVTLLEAMSSGVCCLTTPVGCAADLGRDGVNVMMMPFDEPAAFADATLRAWTEPALRTAMARHSRETIVAHADSRDTSRRFAEAYRVAVRTFAERNPNRAVPDVTAITAHGATGLPRHQEERVPREALDEKEAREAAVLEKLFWAEHLALDKAQRAHALRLMMQSWTIDPRSLSPLSAIMRHFLPQPIVRGVVRAKRGLRRLSGQSLANTAR